MKFELTILGCGAATPNLQRSATSQILNINEKLYLIDCGEATQLKLRRYKFKFQKIDAIFISHLHGDHYLGLMGLLYSMNLMGRKKKLQLICPPGLDELINLQLKLSKSFLTFEIEYIFTGKEYQCVFSDKLVDVYTIPLKHRITTNGYLFIEKLKQPNIIKEKVETLSLSIEWINKIKEGEDYTDENGKIIPNTELTIPAPSPRSYAFCSDTAYNEDLKSIIKNVDLLYHESTFLSDLEDRAKITKHSTAQQAGKIARISEVKKLVLGHYSARYDDLSPFLEEARKEFKEAYLGEEGVKFSVN